MEKCALKNALRPVAGEKDLINVWNVKTLSTRELVCRIAKAVKSKRSFRR